MEVKPGYKKTDIGIFPEDWQVRSIKDLSFDISDGNYSSKYPKSEDFVRSGVPFIRANNIRNMKVIDEDIRFISRTLHSELQKGHLKRNDILITTRGEIGQIAFVPDEHLDSNINAQLVRINTGNTINHRFIGYALAFDTSQKQFMDLQTGSALKQLPVGRLITLKIAIPQKSPEQEAIAEALSDADALIESLEQLIAKKRQIQQGAMQELLRPKKGWVQKKLGAIAHIKTGSRNNQDKVEDGEYPFFVRSATVERINTYSYNCEAILIPGEGGIGSIFHYIVGRFDVHQRVYAITQFTDGTCGKYVYYYMVEKFGAHAMQNTVKATVDSLRLPTFENFEVNLPATKGEQISISNVVSDMETEIRVLENRLAKARQIKQGMMQELLTGRIRLV